jgi:hypothetical protein
LLSLKVQVGSSNPVADAETNSKPAGKVSVIPGVLEEKQLIVAVQYPLTVKVSVSPTLTGSGVAVFSKQ